MSDFLLTGSEALRFNEIQKYWLVFSPSTKEDCVQSKLYTTPLGQDFAAVLNVNSGSYTKDITGSIEITKDIHRFDDETEAQQFLVDIGIENIVSYTERTEESDLLVNKKLIEIQVLNFPQLNFSFDFDNRQIEKGFFMRVFKSGSVGEGGMREVSREVKFDRRGNVSSDTYLKFFEIVTDREKTDA